MGSPHPRIAHRRGPHSALPYVAPDGPFVWQVMETWEAEARSVEAAATALGTSAAAVQAALTYNADEGSGYVPIPAEEDEDTAAADATPVLERIGQALAVVAGLASLVYIAGGLVLAARLNHEGLPWEPVVGQLPREFLISVGLAQVVLPALVVGAVYGLIRLLHRSRTPKLRPLRFRSARTRLLWLAHAVMLAGATIFVAVQGSQLVDKDPPAEPTRGFGPPPQQEGFSTLWWVVVVVALVLLALGATELRARLANRAHPDWHALRSAGPMTAVYAAAFVPAFIAVFAAAPLNEAKVCTPSGFSSVGVLIGQTSDRVYLGEQQPAFEIENFDPRITVFPVAKVEAVLVGATSRGGADCNMGGAMRAVLANASADMSAKAAAEAAKSSERAAVARDADARRDAARAAGAAAQQVGSAANEAANRLLFLVPAEGVRVSEAGRAAAAAGRRAEEAATGGAADEDRLTTSAAAAAEAAAEANRRVQEAVEAALAEAVADSG